jgi:prepilin-type N-terminal cleavage/methylation domain-containing protein
MQANPLYQLASLVLWVIIPKSHTINARAGLTLASRWPTLKHMRNESGFTLLELTIVLAITGLLLLGVLSGASYLLRRARFDAAIDQTVQNLNYARNYALANVNTQGPGNTTVGPGGGPTVFAGAAFEFDTAHTNGELTELKAIYALENPDSTLNSYNDNPYTDCVHPGQAPAPDCAAVEQPFSALATGNYTLKNGSIPITTANIVYINRSGAVLMCGAFNDTQSYNWDCNVGGSTNSNFGQPFNITITDANGFTSTINVDPASGFAKRLN